MAENKSTGSQRSVVFVKDRFEFKAEAEQLSPRCLVVE